MSSCYRVGVIHGDQYEILEQFSKASACKRHFYARAQRIALTFSHAQAWDRFLSTYKFIMKFFAHFSLEEDEQEKMYEISQTAFEVVYMFAFQCT